MGLQISDSHLKLSVSLRGPSGISQHGHLGLVDARDGDTQTRRFAHADSRVSKQGRSPPAPPHTNRRTHAYTWTTRTPPLAVRNSINILEEGREAGVCLHGLLQASSSPPLFLTARLDVPPSYWEIRPSLAVCPRQSCDNQIKMTEWRFVNETDASFHSLTTSSPRCRLLPLPPPLPATLLWSEAPYEEASRRGVGHEGGAG